MDIWQIMYDRARAVLNPRTVSPFIEAGGVAAAVLTKAGNIYVGVCIDTADCHVAPMGLLAMTEKDRSWLKPIKM